MPEMIYDSREELYNIKLELSSFVIGIKSELASFKCGVCFGTTFD